MAHTISEKTAHTLLGLFPTAQGRPDGPEWLVDQLVAAELHRRGTPDAVSGAKHALALTQGALLKEEYDVSTHGFLDGWTLGAVLADPLEFTLYNMRYGFPAGDAALKAVVRGLQQVCPKAKVVRTHTDGFAALLGPTAEQAVTPELAEQARAAMAQAVREVTPDDGAPRDEPRFTVGLLELTLVDPPNWQVLGPLAWAECERALIIARRSPAAGVQRRHLALNGRLPDFGDR